MVGCLVLVSKFSFSYLFFLSLNRGLQFLVFVLENTDLGGQLLFVCCGRDGVFIPQLLELLGSSSLIFFALQPPLDFLLAILRLSIRECGVSDSIVDDEIEIMGFLFLVGTQAQGE